MKLIFFDTETTSNQPDCRLVQYAMVDPGSEGEKMRTAQFICNPGVPIALGAMATHHITDEMAQATPALLDSMRDFLNGLAQQYIFVAHNAQFDVGVMKNEGVEIPNYICTLKVAKHLLDLEQYKLQYLRYYFRLDFDQKIMPHDALSDCFVLWRVFEQLANLIQLAYKIDDVEQIHQKMLDITNTPTLLRRIGFGKHKGMEFSKVDKGYLKWLDNQGDHDEDLQYTLDTYLGKMKL